ncbi:MAG: DUF3291 domain-containing protein [Gammaproteobacteria bacterium]|nr:DUF3291 domain-containing protein [Gammaproteobacteria bacterium]MDH5693969.1 DUF3291 domain-containing protein [Gammaproteobacteria bacterium]
MNQEFALAQMNLVKVLHPLDHPAMQEFVDQLDYVNSLAEKADGFIWRYTSEHDVYEEDILLNMSVWTSVEALHKFVYSGEHLDVLKQGAKWTQRIKGDSTVLWWIRNYDFPSDRDAKARMDHLWAHGATEFAFTFAKPFPLPNSATS